MEQHKGRPLEAVSAQTRADEKLPAPPAPAGWISTTTTAATACSACRGSSSSAVCLAHSEPADGARTPTW
eukprot:7253726-Heterocapsa_arctica.AAC.1